MSPIDLEQFDATLGESLSTVLQAPQVHAEWNDRYKLFVSVISPTFEELDEGERQVIAWDHVLRNFGEDVADEIEFIYTEAPSEIEA